MTTTDLPRVTNSGLRLRIEGLAGVFRGASVEVAVGQRVTVGRSRVCEFSAARTPECQRVGRETLEADPAYRRISRRHFRVTFLNTEMVDFEDLSTNGTFVDGGRIDRLVINDLRSRATGVVVSFGDGEELRVSFTRGGGDADASYPKTIQEQPR